MPRAKRTDRAEARRRYRASFEGADDITTDEPAEPTDRVAAARPATAPKTGTAPQPRPGLAKAFRAAFHPVTLREDLALLPTIIRDKSVWLPVLLIAAVAIAFVATAGGNSITVFLAYYFLLPPAMGPAFIGGFLAPRASYLVGFLLGIVSAVGYLAVIASSVSLVPEGSPTTATPVTVQEQLIFAFTSSPLFGIFFAAAAAWYRRFLQLSNPNRGRRGQPPPRSNDGRTRAKGGQARATPRR